MRLHINHIIKVEFLPAFKKAWDAIFTKVNICGGFRGAGLVLFSLERVILELDMVIRTPTPPAAASQEAPWSSKTPSNVEEMWCQTNLVKGRITSLPDSSPTLINQALDQLVKGAT